MKTAVSIPGPLFEAAERQAPRRGISRSQLYAEALERLLDGIDADVTARLDAVYGGQDSSLDEALAVAQRRATAERW